MRESWRRVQVPIFGIVGILLILVVVAVKLGVTSGEQVSGAASYADLVPLDRFEGERCDPGHYDPICGDDGVTYDNLCAARAAGAEPQYQGLCR